MFFRQVLHRDLGCASYVIADGGEGPSSTRSGRSRSTSARARRTASRSRTSSRRTTTPTTSPAAAGSRRQPGATIHVPNAGRGRVRAEPVARGRRGRDRHGADRRARDARPPAGARRLPRRGPQPRRRAVAGADRRLALRRRPRPPRPRRRGRARARASCTPRCAGCSRSTTTSRSGPATSAARFAAAPA